MGATHNPSESISIRKFSSLKNLEEVVHKSLLSLLHSVSWPENISSHLACGTCLPPVLLHQKEAFSRFYSLDWSLCMTSPLAYYINHYGSHHLNWKFSNHNLSIWISFFTFISFYYKPCYVSPCPSWAGGTVHLQTSSCIHPPHTSLALPLSMKPILHF